MTKLCMDCRHSGGLLARLFDHHLLKCLRPATDEKDVNPVTGGPKYEFAAHCRSNGSCGPEGKYWEKR